MNVPISHGYATRILFLTDPKFAFMERKERQEILKSQYHFDCKCTRCVREDIGSDTCPKCPNESNFKKILEPVTKCQHCGQQIRVSTRYAEHLATNALAALDSPFEDYPTRLKNYSKYIETFRQLYGAYSLDHAMFIKNLIDSSLLNVKEKVLDNHK